MNRKLLYPAGLSRQEEFIRCRRAWSSTAARKTTTTTSPGVLERWDDPSFLVGGSPDFASVFGHRQRKIHGHEGDEYDPAYFDKGPKFCTISGRDRRQYRVHHAAITRIGGVKRVRRLMIWAGMAGSSLAG